METGSLTPRRIYFKANICVLCGFAFVQTEVTSTGESTKRTLFNKKLKLTDDKIISIRHVLGEFNHEMVTSNNGVCKKCFRTVERIIKAEKEVEQLQSEIFRSRSLVRSKYELATPSPSKMKTEKRLRRLTSPERNTPGKRKPFPSVVHHVSLVNLPLLLPVNPQQTKLEKPRSESEKHVATAVADKPKPARRSLVTEFSAPDKTFDFHGEVEITIHYESGKKKKIVANPHHISICKAIYKEKDAEKTILDILKVTNPEYVVNKTCELISEECRKICKKDSGSVLSDRSHDGILKFSWISFETELQTLAPNLLNIARSIVSDKPSSMSEKCLIQMLNAVACALHARCREMTTLQYLAGLVLLHGGCTQRDIDRLAKMGLSVLTDTLHKKLGSWQVNLDKELQRLKDKK